MQCCVGQSVTACSAAQAVAKKKEIQRRVGKPVVTDGYEDVSALSLAILSCLRARQSGTALV